MDNFLQLMYEREKIPNITKHGKPRDVVIYEILKIHSKFRKYSSKYKSKVDVPTWEMVQLAILYMDVFLTTHELIGAEKLGMTCYNLAFKYESDDYGWRAAEYTEYTYGREYLKETALIEKTILEAIDYRANLVTPLAFIAEYIYQAQQEKHVIGNNVCSNAELMSMYLLISSDILAKDVSKIAIISLMVVDECLNDYFSHMPGFAKLLANKHILYEVIENDWEEFTTKYDVTNIIDYF